MAVKKRREPAASHNPLAERILGQRAAADEEISLERLEAELGDASRYDIVAALKALEKAGDGQFIAGRKGQRSRFVWGARTGATSSGTGRPVPRKGAASAAPESGKGSRRTAQLVPDKRTARAVTRRAPEKPASAGVSEPTSAVAELGRGLARKALVPPGKRLERTKLSREGAPVSRISRSLQHSFH